MSVLAVLPLLFLGSSWLAPANDNLRAAERLLGEGKAEAAVDKLGQALADEPDSPLIAYNLGNAHYRAKQYEAAVQAYRRVRADKADPELAARAIYNSANALFRIAQGQEQDRPQEALAKYAEALVEYRRALSRAPNDEDAKFNYEYTQRKMEELRKRLEETAKQQPTPPAGEQQPPPTPANQEQAAEQTPPAPSDSSGQQQQAQDQQEHSEQQAGGQNAPSEPRASQEEQAQAPSGAETSEEESTGEPQGGAGTGEAVASSSEEARDRREARALIDTARQEELSPMEFWRQQQHGVVAEPAQDW
ncbi:MAG: tetratricopeptide repeat protein [Candidatus Binatia bacterium]|nr:tetratricopeptide repeat protein [Candidatus Binatia bacterium]